MRVSKNNLKHRLDQEANRVQHFSIRKLSIGAASVLLSTSLYLGVNSGHMVKADTTSESSTEQSGSGSSTTSDTQDTNASSTEVSSSDKAVATTSSQVATNSDSAEKVSTDSATQSANEKTTEKSNASATTSTLDVSSSKNTTNSASTLADSKVANTNALESNDAAFTADKTTIGNDGTSKGITLSLNLTAKAGDVITIKIPKSSAYKIGTDDFESLNGTGTTTFDDSSDSGYYIITDKITQDGAQFTQRINLSPLSNFTGQPLNGNKAINPITDVGTKELQASLTIVDKNGVQIGSKTINYQSIISPQMHPSFSRKPTSTGVPSVLPKTNYTYYLKVGEVNGLQDSTTAQSTLINSAVNYGATITIPVPEGFVLDQTATNDKNNFADGTTITQSGNVITITVPKGAGNQHFQSTNPDGYAIVGYYNVDQPEEDTTIKASGDITITQKVDANGTLLTSSLPAWTETIRGAKNTSVYGDFGSSAASNSTSGELLIDGDPGRIASFGFTNNTAIALSKAEFTIKMADGLLTTSIATPAKSADLEGLTSYTYTATYTDGTTSTGSVDAGGTVTAENGKYISQIVFNPNYVPAGANAQASYYDTNKLQFVAYGTVSTKYKNGTVTKAGDKLVSSITVTSPEIKNKDNAQVFNTSAATNVLIDQSGLTTSNNFYLYQNNQKASSNAGFVATYNSGASKTVNYAKNPIIYYVLPEGTIFNGTLKNVQGNPKFSTFWVGNQQVIKFDYTGTNFKYDTTQTTNWAYLSILPTVTSGTYPIVAYMTTSTGMNSTSNPAVSTIQGFNSAFTEGNVDNTYQIGKQTWTINLASEIYPAGLAKGNKDTNYSSTGTSDDKGSTELNYEVEVVNGTKDAQSATATDVNLYVNLPTEVNFKLTGPISSNNNGETILYSTTAVTLGTSTQPDTSNWLTADQVTDWSTIKAFAIKIPKISANSNSGLYKVTGIDSNLAADAGKTAYLEFESYHGNDDVPSVVQKGADSFAPAITISGTSTIKTALKYTDADGQTHTVNLNYTKQYQDNSSTMSYSDFPSAISGFSSEDQATINALIAKGYKFVPLSDTNNTILDNGGKTWQSDSTNNPDGSAAWGSQVKYYFDGDTVVYKLEHNTVDVTPNDGKSSTDKIPNSEKNYPDGVTNQDLTKTVTRTINIYDKDGKTIVNTIKQDVKFKRTAHIDAVTGKITGYSDYSSFDDNNGQYSEQSFDTPAGYTSHVTYTNLKSTEDGVTAVKSESALVNKVPTDETVDVTFTPNKESVNVRYETADGKTLADSDTLTGDYGTNYTTSAKPVKGYTLKTTPANATGTYSTKNDDVVYIYAPDTETVNVKYVDANGKEIALSDSKSGDYGTTYTTSAKTIDGYHLTNTPSNATGTFTTTNDDVVYTYAPDKQQITIVVTDSSTGEKVNVSIPTDVATTTFTGDSNSDVPSNVTTNVDKVKEYLKSKGYTVPETITIPTTFDSTPNGTSETDANPQTITIEVGHNHTATDKTITKTITYKTDEGDSVADNYTQSVTIHKDTDDVTGNSTYTVDGKTLENGQTTL
ncbi:MucBP domain-containing protein, partial [Lactobacillus psittaci]|uniref:MucBP domain-containing protein n=1 Tax=Lactobacillus psittaci TaxID=116089 RepID=UPI000704C7C2